MSTPNLKSKLQVKTGDTVVVISGANKGKTGKVKQAFPKAGTIIVDGVQMVKRHQKPKGQGMPGGDRREGSRHPGSQDDAHLPQLQKGHTRSP